MIHTPYDQMTPEQKLAFEAEARAHMPPPIDLARYGLYISSPQGSTGPRSKEGKARSSKNRLAHGLCSTALLLDSESPDEFAEVKAKIFTAYAPANPEEELLAEQLVEAQWRLLRARRVEAKTLNDFDQQECNDDLADALWVDEHAKVWQRLQRYLTTAERSHQRALKNLRDARKSRPQTAPQPPAVAPAVEVKQAQPAPVPIRPESVVSPTQFESQKPLTMAAGVTATAFTPRC